MMLSFVTTFVLPLFPPLPRDDLGTFPASLADLCGFSFPFKCLLVDAIVDPSIPYLTVVSTAAAAAAAAAAAEAECLDF